MKKFCILSFILALSAVASPIGTCVTGMLSTHVGNPCTLGDKTFDNFNDSSNGTVSNTRIGFQMVGTEFHLILAPVTGDISPANYQIVGVKDESNISAVTGSSGLANVVNGTGPTPNVVPRNETGGPQLLSGASSVSTLTGPGGVDGANPGPPSLDIQAITAIPEPAPLALIGVGLVCLGLVRKQIR